MTDLAALPEGVLRFANGVPVALHAPGRGLTSVPPAIGELTSLRRVDPDGNALTALPAALARCRGWRFSRSTATGSPRSRRSSAGSPQLTDAAGERELPDISALYGRSVPTRRPVRNGSGPQFKRLVKASLSTSCLAGEKARRRVS
ncbi:hypothetical protein Misp02_44590 [Microtetraspora sp. NBRC 16547]|nr:hypothetical protein Misp02_44590 [Microtetraspora sp. NBRC 16547]